MQANTHIPVVSVVMPCFNAEVYVADAIRSVLAQTLSDLELIVIDDHSSDQTAAVIQSFLPDQRVIYLQNSKNEGVAASINRGMALAKADFIARMDADDIALPTRLAEQFDFLQSHPAHALVGSCVDIIDERGQHKGEKTMPATHDLIAPRVFLYCPILHTTIFFKKAVILGLGGYRPRWISNEDQDLWQRLIYSGHKTANIAKKLQQYRIYNSSHSHKKYKKTAIERFRLRQHARREFGLRLTAQEWTLMYMQLLRSLIIPYNTLRKLLRLGQKLFRRLPDASQHDGLLAVGRQP